MNRNDFRILYEYNDWANDRLISMLFRILGEETDLRQQGPVPLAIQKAAVHIVAAQAIWRARWEGRSPTAMLSPDEYPTPLAIRMAFGAERARFWGFFDTLDTDAALHSVVQSQSTSGEARIFPLWQMMQHVLTHSTYHRGQITGRLLDMGQDSEIVSTDLITYYRQYPHSDPS